MSFAQKDIATTPKDMKVIFHSKKSLFYHNENSCIKKDSIDELKVRVGSYDSAEVCQILVLFMFNKPGREYNIKNIALHKYNILSIFKNKNGLCPVKLINLQRMMKINQKILLLI